MKQSQEVLEGFLKYISCCLLVLFIIPIQSALDQLDIPVTVYIPDQIIYLLAGKSCLESVEVGCDISYTLIDLSKDPLVLVSEDSGFIICHWQEISILALKVHDSESGCIPQLIGKIPCGFEPCRDESHIIAR